jgi:lysophospholipase L1-like esterase
VAQGGEGAAIVANSDREVAFGGEKTPIIPPGAVLLSDPVNLKSAADSDLVISIFFPGTPDTSYSVHSSAYQTSYVSEGDTTGAVNPPTTSTITSWYFLAGVEVSGGQNNGTIVALGDSITDGAVTQKDTNHRWPDFLGARLRENNLTFGVVDEGIGGNRILHDGSGPFGPAFGRSALSRFDRDVLSQPGLRYLIVLEGINDIGHSAAYHLTDQDVTAEQIIAGLRQIIGRAHEHGVLVVGATVTPFAVTKLTGYYTPEGEAKRVAINRWIRESKEFDGVADFEKAVQDPEHPNQMLPAYDSGDHLHPNDAGMKAMAAAIDLALFR